MRLIDRAFCVLLAIGTMGHLIGSFLFYEIGGGLFVWSLSGAMAAALLVVLNWLRSSRPSDRALAWITLVGNLCWIGVVVLFGGSIGNVLDVRVLLHVIAAAGMSYFSFKILQA
jgi:hypothetical protein